MGTTNTKAALVDLCPSGALTAPQVVAIASRATPSDAEGLVGAAFAAMQDVLAVSPGVGIAAVGIASMAETGVPLDRRGRALTPLVMWHDTRAIAQGTALADRAAALFAATGVRPGPKPPLAKWMWFAQEQAETWARLGRWMGAADLVALALTGQAGTDHTLAGRTGAYGLWGPGWLPELLELAGLTEDQVPPVVPVGKPVGRVGAASAGLPAVPASLPPGTPVYIAGHDHAVGAWGAGVRTPGQVADSLGTTEAIYRITSGQRLRGSMTDIQAAGMSLVRTVSASEFALVGGLPGAGEVISWLAGLLGRERLETCEAQLAAAWRQGTPAPLEQLATVLPYVRGRQTPVPDAGARLALLGLSPGMGPVEVYDAVLAGLALHARWMTDEAARLAGEPTVGAVVMGGPTANDPWMRRKAQVSPWPLRRVTELEAVAVGAALVAGVRAGVSETGCGRVHCQDGPALSTTPIPGPYSPQAERTLATLVAAASGIA